MDRHIFKLVKNLVPKEVLQTIEYDALVKVVGEDHLGLKPSEIVERYKFNTRVQQKGESIASFIAALRYLAKHCSYGNSLDDMLGLRLNKSKLFLHAF